MHFSRILNIQASALAASNKTGFGPYRLHRKKLHFVGTEPSVLKYHHVQEIMFISAFFHYCKLLIIFRFQTRSQLKHTAFRERITCFPIKAKFLPNCLLKRILRKIRYGYNTNYPHHSFARILSQIWWTTWVGWSERFRINKVARNGITSI